MASSFSLTPDGLQRIFEAYGLPVPRTGFVLFALRGALPRRRSGWARGWARSVELLPAKVDHVHMRCTLGIWDAGNRRLFAAPGSTVPHKENMAKAAARGGKGTNQLEPGYYTDLAKGEHLQGKPNGHQALRQTASRFYRRSPDGRAYTPKSPLYYGNPYDNLHSGWNLDGKAPGFRSAGCMVVAGTPHCPRHEDPRPNRGPWKIFHDFLYGTGQAGFPILLLPAGEARAALRGGAARADRLVFGSRGEAVKALQKKLKSQGSYRGPVNGRLESRTYKAWNAAGFSA